MAMVKTAEEGMVWAINAYGQVWRWRWGAISITEIVENAKNGWKFIKSPNGIKKIDVGYNS